MFHAVPYRCHIHHKEDVLACSSTPLPISHVHNGQLQKRGFKYSQLELPIRKEHGVTDLQNRCAPGYDKSESRVTLVTLDHAQYVLVAVVDIGVAHKVKILFFARTCKMSQSIGPVLNPSSSWDGK